MLLFNVKASDERGRPVWTVVYYIPHRDLKAEAAFVVLHSGNDTTLTLSDSHMVYVAAARGSTKTPVAARDVQVCSNDRGSPTQC